MEPGERTRVVEIQQLTEGQSASGFPIETWTALATLFASRTDVSGREYFAAGAQVSQRAFTRWEVGYRADLDPELVDVPKRRRLVHQGKIFDISDASLIGQKAGVELTTLAQVAAA